MLKLKYICVLFVTLVPATLIYFIERLKRVHLVRIVSHFLGQSVLWFAFTAKNPFVNCSNGCQFETDVHVGKSVGRSCIVEEGVTDS